MELQKMIAETIEKDDEAARNLTTETKRTFWKALMEDEKSIGEARELAGIDDVAVAVALIIQCYKKQYIPMTVDEIE